MLEVRDVTYSYATGLSVLAGINIAVSAGEVIAIVGPSGCGKSTLLSLLAGLAPADGGKIVWHDARSQELQKGTRRRLTLVFQKDTLLPWLSVESNVAFGLRYLRISESQRRERVARLLKLAGLEDFRKAYPRQLSGGMRRRVALLTGVAPLPEVLLLDEPFSALDEPTRLAIHRDVLAIVYELGMSAILVTHDLGEALSLADRVYVLTRRPARVAWEHAVPFGHLRDVYSIRESPTYQGMYGKLWHELREQLNAPPARI